MKTRKLLTRRQAWRFLLKKWQHPNHRHSQLYTMLGLCWSIRKLYSAHRISEEMREEMKGDLNKIRPYGCDVASYFWAPIGPYPNSVRQRVIAIKRILKRL